MKIICSGCRINILIFNFITIRENILCWVFPKDSNPGLQNPFLILYKLFNRRRIDRSIFHTNTIQIFWFVQTILYRLLFFFYKIRVDLPNYISGIYLDPKYTVGMNLVGKYDNSLDNRCFQRFAKLVFVI